MKIHDARNNRHYLCTFFSRHSHLISVFFLHIYHTVMRMTVSLNCPRKYVLIKFIYYFVRLLFSGWWDQKSCIHTLLSHLFELLISFILLSAFRYVCVCVFCNFYFLLSNAKCLLCLTSVLFVCFTMIHIHSMHKNWFMDKRKKNYHDYRVLFFETGWMNEQIKLKLVKKE